MSVTRKEVEALMKRCQIGVGGRNALDRAHDIMAECYGTLGALLEQEYICRRCGLREESGNKEEPTF